MPLNSRLFAALVIITVLAPFRTALAESPEAAEIRALKAQLGQSMKLIEDLATKVQQLEKRLAAPTEPATAPVATQAKIDALQAQVDQLGVGLARRVDDGASLHGFADVGYVSSNEDRDDRVGKRGRKGFAVGSLDLYLTPKFGDRVKTLVELIFEVEHDGHLFTDLERAQIGYTFSDAATGWLGRFHTPYGYWNTAFHHGAQIQTSILRPRFLEFEDKGGILPAHLTGAWLTGGLGTGVGRLNYDLYYANAPKIVIDSELQPAPKGTLDMRMAGNRSTQSMAGFNFGLSPNAVPGLRVGLHGMRGTVEDDLAPANHRTRLGMLGGYGLYLENDWEVLTEYFGFRNRDLDSGDRRGSHAWYGQVGRGFGALTPFARIERTRLDQADPYFSMQDRGRSYRRGALGLRYDVDPKAAVKVEWLRTRESDLVPGIDDRYDEWRLQYSIRF
jgi:hypothetical protein